MQQQMTMGMGGPGQAPDLTKVFAAEKTEVEICQHEFVVADAEYKLLGLAPPPRSKGF